jgi:hypothetical protein
MPNDATPKHNVELYFISILILFAFGIEIISLIPALKPNSESIETWFQRSGAITAIFATFAQFRINNFLESIRGGTFAESWTLYRIFIRRQTVISWLATFTAIWGAMVWAYGDLIFARLFK